MRTAPFSLVMLALLLPGAALASPPLHAGVDAENSRASFNRGWLFARFGPMGDGSQKEEPPGLEGVNIADSLWRKLDLPHDWGIESPFIQALPGNTGKLPWAGIGWYRKHFKIPPADKGKLLFVDFDGAMSHASVWLNGRYLGQWPYGYASFRLEMTDAVRFDEDNILAVRLDNPPESSRWYPGGGIYRNVWLVKTGPVHVAHWGSTVWLRHVGKDSASVVVRTEIDATRSPDPAGITLVVRIGEPGKSGSIVSSRAIRMPEFSGGMSQCEVSLRVPSPRLWDIDSPHLYCARTSVLRNGRVVDSAETVFGIRTAVFTADSGFVLNGRRVRINGVCDHHDLGPLGTAVNVSALARQIRLLKDMGCNAIRTSHNPPAPELLDLCDRMGMLVLDEAFDCWKKGKTPNDYSTLFGEWHERDIRAYVRRDRNHACVIAWSSGNEVWEEENGELVGELRRIFRSEDPTRPVTAACDRPDAGFDGFQDSVDTFGYNYKPHMYGKFREANPAKPLFGSETASCVSTNGSYFFPVSEDKSKGWFDSQVSSYDLYAPQWATIPDVEFEGQDRNPSVAGEFVWTGFDYLGEPTPYGEGDSPSRSSYFGILDICGFRKDRFYLYQARWRPDHPLAHILPHWNWENRLGEVTPVHVYTSGDEAELFLNGRSLGRKKVGPYQYRLRWDEVRYAPGELKVVAYRGGRKWAEDVVRTAGRAARLELSADRAVIASDGCDLAFVTARIVDKDGLLVPAADNLVRFSLRGPAGIAATGNGDPTDHASFQSPGCRAFHGQCLLIIRSADGRGGRITVTAEAQDLAGADFMITSRKARR